MSALRDERNKWNSLSTKGLKHERSKFSKWGQMGTQKKLLLPNFKYEKSKLVCSRSFWGEIHFGITIKTIQIKDEVAIHMKIDVNMVRLASLGD